MLTYRVGRALLLVAFLLLSGCGVYRIERIPLSEQEHAALPELIVNPRQPVSLIQQGDSECVGGMLFLFTVGMFPMTCDETWYPDFVDADKESRLGYAHTYSLRTLKGWPYLWFMPISSDWHFGYSSSAINKIERELNSQ